MIRCLIVDDNLSSIDPLLTYLEGNQEDFLFFYSREKNCEDIEKNLISKLPWTPDVILLDLMMAKKSDGFEGELGGITFLENLNQGKMEPKIPRHTKVICLSGYEGIDIINEKHGEKFFLIFPKPMNIFAVVKAFKKAANKEGKNE